MRALRAPPNPVWRRTCGWEETWSARISNNVSEANDCPSRSAPAFHLRRQLARDLGAEHQTTRNLGWRQVRRLRAAKHGGCIVGLAAANGKLIAAQLCLA